MTNPETEIIALHSGASAKFVQAPGEGPLPTVLIVHGWQSRDPLKADGSYAAVQEALKGAGFNSLVLSLRGHAHSEGDIKTVSRADHLADITAAVMWLMKQRTVDMSRLSGYATSYGAYLLATSPWVATMKLLAFRVAALYPDGGWDEPTQAAIDNPLLKEWRKAIHEKDECRALSGLSKFRGHFVLFNSELDEYMPPEIAESYRRAASASATGIQSVVQVGAKHVLDAAQNAEFLSLLQKWFSDHSQGLP